MVIGGYGGFGARLSRRLAAAGHIVLVVGRNGGKAARFAATLARAEGVALDRNGDLGIVLAEHRPELVIDAAGPFQDSDYRVPEACIAARIDYLDLADARGFVTGIGALDDKARAAGVAVIAGASSAPALTGAVVRRLADGLERVVEVEIALSAANRATAGASVARAILSYVGRPLPLRRGGRWREGHGWQELRIEHMQVGGLALGRRLAGLIDVPDHLLLPELLPGRPAVTFRAGNDLSSQMLCLWLLSWPVRWRWLRALSGAAPLLLILQKAMLWAGGDRSGMRIALTGIREGQPVRRQWTILAEQDHGPEIPTLAAALLAGDELVPGAYDASALLDFDRFAIAFEGLAVRHEVIEEELPPPLYARLMGEAFAALPSTVRELHRVHGDAGAEGEGEVVRGRHLLARLIGAVMGFPPAGTHQLHVAFAARGGKERWTRDFGGHCFASELSEAHGLAQERFGPMRFGFALVPTPDGLRMDLKRWSAFGLRLPLFLAPRIAAREHEADGLFHFDVAIRFPLIGEIVHYRGRLRPILN